MIPGSGLWALGSGLWALGSGRSGLWALGSGLWALCWGALGSGLGSGIWALGSGRSGRSGLWALRSGLWALGPGPWALGSWARPEPKSAPNECFSELWGYVSGRRQIWTKAVRSPKVLQINACLSFGDRFLCGASAGRSWPKPHGAQKCFKLMLF